MKLDKILRVLVCLALVCCLTIHAMIPKAEATAVVEGIAYISSVLGPVGTVAAVSVIALGLWAGANPDDFDNIVNGVSTHLSEIGTNMKDGFVQMLQVTDSAGAKQLYIAAETLENVRSWLFDSSTLFNSSNSAYSGETYSLAGGQICKIGTAYSPVTHFRAWAPLSNGAGYFYDCFISSGQFSYFYNGGSEKWANAVQPDQVSYRFVSFGTYYASPPSGCVSIGVSNVDYTCSTDWQLIRCFEKGYFGISSVYDVSLGTLSNSAIVNDVSVYDSTWNANQLRVAVAYPENNEPEYKVYFPVPLPSNYEDLHSVTQSDVLTGAITGVPDLGEDEEYVIEELPIVDGYQGVIVSPSDTQSGTTTGAVTLPGWLSDGINNLLQGLKDILSGILALPVSIAKAIWDALPAWLTEGISNMVTGLRDILDAIKALPVAIAEALAAIFVPSADYITAKVEALRSEFGFIDSVIATGEFIRDSISGDSGPPVIYVDLGRAPSGNYGSQRVLLTDFSWYAPYKGQVDTVLSAALWAFFGWKVFLNLPSIIGGESGYISDIAFYESGGYYGGRAKEIRSGRSSRSKEKGGKG